MRDSYGSQPENADRPLVPRWMAWTGVVAISAGLAGPWLRHGPQSEHKLGERDISEATALPLPDLFPHRVKFTLEERPWSGKITAKVDIVGSLFSGHEPEVTDVRVVPADPTDLPRSYRADLSSGVTSVHDVEVGTELVITALVDGKPVVSPYTAEVTRSIDIGVGDALGDPFIEGWIANDVTVEVNTEPSPGSSYQSLAPASPQSPSSPALSVAARRLGNAGQRTSAALTA